MSEAMYFEPLYYNQKLTVITPTATIAVLTLWSSVSVIREKLEAAGAPMEKIAVMGNLYGEGFRYLLRNLLNNPQIDTVLILGRDISGSGMYLDRFFYRGLVDVTAPFCYETEQGFVEPVRISGTGHIMDGLVRPESFHAIPNIVFSGKMHYSKTDIESAVNFLEKYKSHGWHGKRQNIPVPKIHVLSWPSNIYNHNISENSIKDAYEQLIFKLVRFGRLEKIAKGDRIEIPNMKVTILDPRVESFEDMKACGHEEESLKKYYQDFLKVEDWDDQPYTYADRLREYFDIDTIEEIAANLNNEKFDDRKGYATLWDNFCDITGSSSPCLVSLFFRKTNDNKISLTATFRSHNAAKAWYANVYGIMTCLLFVCNRVKGSSPGPITVFSHSISLDPAYMEEAQMVYERVEHQSRERRDPNGHFIVYAENSEIVVEHWLGGDILNTDRGTNPEKMRHRLARTQAVSDVGHALFLGGEIEKTAQKLKENQDDFKTK